MKWVYNLYALESGRSQSWHHCQRTLNISTIFPILLVYVFFSLHSQKFQFICGHFLWFKNQYHVVVFHYFSLFFTMIFIGTTNPTIAIDVHKLLCSRNLEEVKNKCQSNGQTIDFFRMRDFFPPEKSIYVNFNSNNYTHEARVSINWNQYITS